VYTTHKADGGTAGMSAGGSVSGAGSAFSDTAGMYRLANGEEVTSDKFGQASHWRPLLKMINMGAPAGQIAGKAVHMAGATTSGAQLSAGRDRPIFMDGSLFGVLREMANGEAQIVVNQANTRQKMGLTAGRQKGSF
jgi:hypothetical protein